jgi:excisionase family DNA binding protein
MPDLADYMSTEDAAKALDLHVETIRLFLRYKKLDGLKVGRTWLVSRAAVKAYQAQVAGKEKHDPTRKPE